MFYCPQCKRGDKQLGVAMVCDDCSTTEAERVATIQAPPEEMKAFAAGLRVGYKKGWTVGFADGVASVVQPEIDIEPSEVLFNKPKIQ